MSTEQVEKSKEAVASEGAVSTEEAEKAKEKAEEKVEEKAKKAGGSG